MAIMGAQRLRNPASLHEYACAHNRAVASVWIYGWNVVFEHLIARLMSRMLTIASRISTRGRRPAEFECLELVENWI